ncbi:MAG TPA: putative sulfate exporter family transporter [Firmicutes bacterium]|nr:putative sulfate exporter family transporter [Bacillota bacterium]
MFALWKKEDWWTIWLGALLLLGASTGLIKAVPKLPKWTVWQDALPGDMIAPIVLWGIFLAVLTGFALKVMGEDVKKYWQAFPTVFFLAVLAFLIGNHKTLAHYGVNDIIWALALGMLISNLWGKPRWLMPAIRTELFIKTGLVLLGAEILFNRVLSLGVYGLGVAWIVTPIVVLFMYYYGTKVLKIESKSLVATVATCTSVCGVSAAIATGAAVKAKKEEISAAISVSLIFTALMMVGMPVVIRWLGLSQAVAGAWIGGTVDSTGAVVVAGSMVGPQAMEVAAIVKMLQNVLIGIVAFCWALYWVTKVERVPGRRPSLKEVWIRFPKFILGFAGASVVFSFLLLPRLGQVRLDEILKVTSTARGWLFALAFVTIGLDSRFADLKKAFKDQGPVKLYVVGQTFNLVLTILAALFFFRNF